MKTNTKIILLSNLKTFEGLSQKKLLAIEKSMIEYAHQVLEVYKNRETKDVITHSFKYFPAITKDNVILYLRKKAFNKAKKKAQYLADIENRKVYVIRESIIGYKVLTTLDVDYHKRIRVLSKDASALKLTQIADFIAMPNRKKPETSVSG